MTKKLNLSKLLPSNVSFHQMGENDFEALDGSQRQIVLKSVRKVAKNPLPKALGGYGTPLGNKYDITLVNFLKVKLKKSGIRIVY